MTDKREERSIKDAQDDSKTARDLDAPQPATKPEDDWTYRYSDWASI